MPSCLTELIGATRGDSAEYSLCGIVEGVDQRADKKGGDTDGLKSFVKSIKLPGVLSTAQTVGTQLYEPGSTSAKMAFIIGTRAGHWQAQSLTPTHHRPTPHAQATVEHRRRQLEACTIQLLHCVTQALHTAITLSILSTWALLVLRGQDDQLRPYRQLVEFISAYYLVLACLRRFLSLDALDRRLAFS